MQRRRSVPRPRTTLLLLLVLAACGGSEDAVIETPAPRAARVRALTLAPQTWTETIHTYGVFEAAEEVSLSVDFAATVRRVRLREGGRVEAGATLVEFDRGERELLLDRAAQSVENVRAQLEQAQRTLRRNEDLFAAAAITREEVERSRAGVRGLTAQYSEALAGRRLAERDLGETTLVSPVAGRVVRRSAEPGETVLPGQVLGVIQTAGTLRVSTFVSEKDINALRVGDPARVTTPGVRGRLYEARIESLGVQADPRTGNFPVKLTVPNDDGLLRAGMTARLEITGLEVEGALLIPAGATVDRQRRRVVYTVVDGRAVEVEPVLAATLGDRVPVHAGLEAGDVVIVEGLEGLVDGSPVKVVEMP